MLPTLPRMLSPDSSNNLDIRLHSGDKVTGENSVLLSGFDGAMRLLPAPPLTRARALVNKSSSKDDDGVVVSLAVEELMNSNGVTV